MTTIQEPKAPEAVSQVYSPNAIINLINNAISIKEEKAIIIIRGEFLSGQGKDYNGYFYDSLRDENGSCVLPLKISALDRSKVSNGAIIEIKGFITRKVDDKGFIKILANVSEVLGQKAPTFSDADLLAFELMQKKASIGFKDVEGFLSSCVIDNKRPVVKIVVGHTAIIDKDIQHSMGEAITFFNPQFIKINLSSVEAIVAQLSDPKAHVLVIARGGGTGLEIFNSVAIAEAALNCKSYLISAIGHREDVTLIDKLVDKNFITPTDVGNFFRAVYNKVSEQLVNSKGKLIEEVTKQVKKEFEEKILLQDKLLIERAAQIKNMEISAAGQITTMKLVFYMGIALILGIIIALFLK